MDFLIPIFNTLVLAVVLILVMVGLMSAPWHVLLFILILGIITYQWLIKRHHLQGILQDISGSEFVQMNSSKMNIPETNVSEMNAPDSQSRQVQPSEHHFDQVLYYRGASYMPSVSGSDSVPDDSSSVEVSGKYRGGSWKSSQ